MKLPPHVLQHNGGMANMPPANRTKFLSDGGHSYRWGTEEEMQDMMVNDVKYDSLHYWQPSGTFWQSSREGKYVNGAYWYITTSPIPVEKWKNVVSSKIGGKG